MPASTREAARESKPSHTRILLAALAWGIAIGLIGVATYLGWKDFQTWKTSLLRSRPPIAKAEQFASQDKTAVPSMPETYVQAALLPSQLDGISRRVVLHTIIPNRPSEDVRKYIVAPGDSVFEIASKFNIKPETLLWANYDQLNDNPDMISVGMELNVPPVDGVYYQAQKGDTIEGIAARFEAKVDDILGWMGNRLDLANPELEAGTWVMVPGGHREFRQWIIPVIPRGRAGVSKSVYGAGACEGSYEGAYGSGSFIWPAGNHYLSGNDYWSGHLGIDIAAGEGAPIFAADSGVVVFAGWATGGYGDMVMIDHGNGYQTLYAHMSRVAVSCGRSVAQGQTIGYSGSTGNSTGAHLHFEVRYQGGFVNPWYVLPAP